MNERVQGCGGKLEVTPLAGRGTRVEAIFPLTPAPDLVPGMA